ncbi:MAG: type II toxin-antitoxin system VapC family toxin [Solirubrobacterales bacterium]
MLAWDTTLVSRLYPGGLLERHLLDRLHAGEPVAVTAPTVMEVVTGIQATARTDPRVGPALTWFTRLLTSDLVEVLSLDRPAAILAGRLRALHPTPPTGARRKGTKPEHRAGWVLDIQIAACAWTHGRELATENMRDFEALRELIAKLHPDTSPLAVANPPPQ